MAARALRVLVADDQPLIRWALARALGARGHEVLTAGTREEACARLFHAPFDAVVVSRDLNGEDMTDVMRELLLGAPATRLVALDESEGDGAAGEMPPGLLRLPKPFELARLVEALERHTG